MLELGVNFNGDGALADVGHISEADAIEVMVLDRGMGSGKPSVGLHITVDGEHVLAQTSARLFCTAARMIMAKYPDLFED